MSQDAWADKLVELFADDPEKLAELMMYLANHPEHHFALNKCATVDRAFKAYLDKISPEIDGTLVHYLDEKSIVLANHANGFQLKGKEALQVFSASGLAVVERLPLSMQEKVLKAITSTLENSNFQSIKGLGGRLSKVGPGKLATYAKYGGVALLSVQLGWEAISSMKSWWNGEISGKRAAKQFVDALGSIGSGVVGGELGFMMGAAAGGPLGGVAGALVGGLTGSLAGGSLTDRLTQFVFDVPKDTALENAYNFLGVHHDVNNTVVNKKFKDLCLKYHPDKGGAAEEFHKLQISMQIIRLARGQA